jgi:DNA-binding Lrp family transcriptional regulator
MDEVDIRICQMLMQDSRTPLRELGDRLGLTVAAIHRRVQALQNLGIIRAYTGNLSLNHLGAVPVHGWSKEALDEMASALEQDARAVLGVLGFMFSGEGHKSRCKHSL